MKKCSIDNCVKKWRLQNWKEFFIKWYCNSHYQEIKKYWYIKNINIESCRKAFKINGDTCIPIWINGKYWYTIIDNDFSYLDIYKWNLSRWYVVTKIKNKTTSIHRLIMWAPPYWHNIDHINRNKLDNRKSNLRFSTFSENSLNRWINSNNKSWIKWLSYLKKENVRKYGIMVKWVRKIKYFKIKDKAIEYIKTLT